MRVGKRVGKRARRVVREEVVEESWERNSGAERRPRTWWARRVERTFPPKVVPWEPVDIAKERWGRKGGKVGQRGREEEETRRRKEWWKTRRTDGDDLDDLVSNENGSDGDTVGERLGHGDDVGTGEG